MNVFSIGNDLDWSFHKCNILFIIISFLLLTIHNYELTTASNQQKDNYHNAITHNIYTKLMPYYWLSIITHIYLLTHTSIQILNIFFSLFGIYHALILRIRLWSMFMFIFILTFNKISCYRTIFGHNYDK